MVRNCTIRGLFFAVAWAALVACPGSLRAGQPSDKAVAAAVAEFSQRTSELSNDQIEQFRKVAIEVAGRFPIEEMSLEQLRVLQRSGMDDLQALHRPDILALLDKREEIRLRLETLASDTGPAGATAALMRTKYLPVLTNGVDDDELDEARKREARAVAEAAVAALEHPGMPELYAIGRAEELNHFFGNVSTRTADSLRGLESRIMTFQRLLSDDLPPQMITRSVAIFELVAGGQLHFEAGFQEELRLRLLELVNRQISQSAEGAARLRSAETFLKGAYAKGELLGHVAPELEIIWTSHPKEIRSLADLQGSVVVLDFWATWCGPCVASFPKMRELVARYEGFPVVVVGITSIQGRHTNHKSADPTEQRVDTRGDPARETALMAEFMEQMEIGWPVAFTKEDVFNPDYGIRGIPHLVIIDSNGRVRHRGLHPKNDSDEIIRRIDVLLREAGLPAPSAHSRGD